MHVHPYIWIVTIVIMVALLLADALILGRRPHMPTMKECVSFIGLYVVLAVLFGLGVIGASGGEFGKQFFAVWLTEYSLSLDNLFIFIILMTKFKVPGYLQQFTLLVGIMVALLFRGVFIGLGQAVLNAWAWVFFLFGAFLLYSAIGLVRDYLRKTPEDEDAGDNAVMRWVRKHLPATGDYRGAAMFVREDGKILATSLFIVVLALSTADLLFALDSIPASYGLTGEAYLIFTANVFALMGLRQLYFLLGNLLHKLVYLPLGLSVILGFISVKLILHALHHYGLDQRWFGVRTEISVEVSLAVIVVTLLVTAVTSIIHSRRVGRGADAAGS
ncbi:TerC/Alx family metal homeostasis membrane protein [Acidipropionibacterium virtanenii]|uniref:Putative membrane protein n=1 Tax=Acidipropionibacterium virtanenii TaxID=2057246 RepID=A0A344UV74_9ACTN|nr:TerC/Alx family metal homeostasis membrane protein [Acidipropionibacterium virtanenii]AXE39172.1 putative membrane protein [Acidipropionibacterium virtanenii]